MEGVTESVLQAKLGDVAGDLSVRLQRKMNLQRSEGSIQSTLKNIISATLFSYPVDNDGTTKKLFSNKIAVII